MSISPWSVMDESPSLASLMVPLHWLMILDRTIVLLALDPEIGKVIFFFKIKKYFRVPNSSRMPNK